MINAGRLRHRIILEEPRETQDQNTGAVNIEWVEVDALWASIEPLSAREFIAAQAEASKVSARITIRYRSDINYKMRFYHASKDKYYNIEGILADPDSGLEYITCPCSEGVRYENGELAVPDVITPPIIDGTSAVGQTLTTSTGVWANEPEDYDYQWYVDDIAITGQTNNTFIVPNNIGSIITVGVIASNVTGDGDESFSDGKLIF